MSSGPNGGDIDATDGTLAEGYEGWQLGWNELSHSSVANRIGYAGYHKDINLDISHVRNRVLEPHLGRWTRRDPLGYVDGMGLYQYVRSIPGIFMDPMGLKMIIYAFEGFLGREALGTNHLQQALPHYKSQVPNFDRFSQVRYYYDSQLNAAWNQLRQDQEETFDCYDFDGRPTGARPCYHTIVVLGYSYGGDTALALVDRVFTKHEPNDPRPWCVVLAFTIDPVGKGEIAEPHRGQSKSGWLTVQPNMDAQVNYYQTEDTGSFGGAIRIWGDKVRIREWDRPGTHEGTNLQLTGFARPEAAHIDIVQDARVIEGFKRSLQQVIDTGLWQSPYRRHTCSWTP